MPNPPSWVKPTKGMRRISTWGLHFRFREDAGLIAFRRLIAFVGTGGEKAQAELSRNSQQAAPRQHKGKSASLSKAWQTVLQCTGGLDIGITNVRTIGKEIFALNISLWIGFLVLATL